MSKYNCKCCQYETNRKSSYEKHLQSKRHIKCIQMYPMHPFLDTKKLQPNEQEEKENNNEEDEEILIPEKEIFKKILNKNKEVRYICQYCNKTYKYRQGLSKHIKYSCKYNKDESFQELAHLLNEKDEQINENKKEIEKLQKQIEKLSNKLQIKNIHNGDNNITNTMNFNILNYNKTDYQHLTDYDYINCIKDCNYCVKALIEKVHFNKDKPENMNIYISSIRGNFVMVYKDDKWQVKDRTAQIDDIYEYNEIVLSNWYDEYKEKYPDIIKSFKRYLTNKEDDELINKVKKELLLMLYNNRDLVQNNYGDQPLQDID